MPSNDKFEDVLLKDGTLHRMPVPTSGVGNPTSPEYRKLLTEEDEKRIDDKGQLVVHGKTWSKASTGVYLTVAITAGGSTIDRPWIRERTITLPTAFSTSGRRLTIGSTTGKPRFIASAFWGACLELPDDLGKDGMKQQYVVEWLVGTLLEALEISGCSIPPKMSEARKEVGYWVQGAAEAAIAGAGF